jgi:signal transduction histidine kinase
VAQRFEKTGRHFTFIAHDIKNVVSQLGLLVRQAERHADRPEFMADALDTVRESVERMKRLLVKLRDLPDGGQAGAGTALEAMLHEFVARNRLIFPRVDLAVAADLPPARVEAEALSGVLENLLQNAIEAGGPETVVCITARQDRGELMVELHDTGPGMAAEQVERLLYSPFSSTKSTGFGIGLFQCRCQVEQWGGRLSVDSAPGEGTTVRLHLPPATLPLAQVR